MPKKGKKQVRSGNIKSKNDFHENSAPAGDFPGLPPASGGQRGLVNLGNTCYLNSVLQCLSVSNPFRDSLVSLAEEGLGGVGASLCSVFHGLQGCGGSGKAKGGTGGACSPKQLLSQICSNFPWYKGGEQQDAHELLRTLLGSVADEPTATEKKQKKERGPHTPSTPCGEAEKLVWQSFRGRTCAAVLCWKCHRVSVRVDPFLDLSLELPISEEQAGLLGLPSRIAQLEVGGSCSSSCRTTSRAQDEIKEEAKDSSACPARSASSAPSSNASKLKAQGVPFFMRPSVATWYQPLRRLPSTVQDSEAADSAEPADGLEAERMEEPEPFTFKVHLRKHKKKDPRWGFGWCNDSLQQKRLRVATVNPDTVLDKWNLKKKSMDEEDLVVREGDEIIAVGGAKTFVMMQQLLKEEVVDLTVQRRFCSVTSACSGKVAKTAAATESDADDQEAAEITARSFLQAALDCHSSMVEDLQAVFSDPVSLKVNGSCQLQDCFLKFTSSEAVEDDLRPVYQCSECAKVQRGSDGKETKAMHNDEDGVEETEILADADFEEDGDEMSSGEILKETDEEEIIDVGALNEVQEQVFEDAETLGPSR
ncbi:UBP2 [Symbiodinium pilosum]|uniref:ubiquitinyl hydrolase 1 n=1 Tax=Symbiodinium pilosum TaxID=2952 RepID=A0A812W2M7_SYMPI|nr:UBP2 [Symbiodinium pilosum]